MKKAIPVLFALFALTFAAFADDDFGFGLWYDSPEQIKNKKIDGLALGLPVVSSKQVEGASLSLFGNETGIMEGFQGTLLGYNKAKALHGVQLSFVNFQQKQHDDPAVQIGIYNQADGHGVQIGLVNYGKNNATFQFGLINVNKHGLFPVFPFVNFNRRFFDRDDDWLD